MLKWWWVDWSWAQVVLLWDAMFPIHWFICGDPPQYQNWQPQIDFPIKALTLLNKNEHCTFQNQNAGQVFLYHCISEGTRLSSENVHFLSVMPDTHTAPGVCSRCVCVHVFTVVCVHFGWVNVEHEFKYGSPNSYLYGHRSPYLATCHVTSLYKGAFVNRALLL